MSGHLPAIGAKEIEPLEMVDRVAKNAVERREGPEALSRAIWRDESGAEVWVHLQGDAPRATTVIFRGSTRYAGRLAGFSPPVDGPLNGQILVTGAVPELAPRLALDLAEYGDAAASICAGRRVSVGVAALLTEGQLFADRATYLAACSRRGNAAPTTPLWPVGLRPQGDRPNATLVGTVAGAADRCNSLTGESFLALTVEWDGGSLEVAANAADLSGGRPVPGAYLAACVWLVGFDLQYATVISADAAELPFGPGTVAAFAGWNGYLQLLQVTHVDRVPPAGLVVHLRIFAELFDSVEALQAHQGERQIAVSHLPLDAGALLDSELVPLGTAALTAVDEETHHAWRQAFERGEAGIFALPLDQVMAWMANAQAAAQAPADAAVE